jgi:hypothetical protein
MSNEPKTLYDPYVTGQKNYLKSKCMQPGLHFGSHHTGDYAMIDTTPLIPVEFRKRDKSKEVQKNPFSTIAPPTQSFDELNAKTLTINRNVLKKRGQLKKILEKDIPIYGSARTKPVHERANSVLAQGKHILLSKIPKDCLADFEKRSASRMHFKGSASLYLQSEPSTRIHENDTEIKKCLGITKDNKNIKNVIKQLKSNGLNQSSEHVSESHSPKDGQSKETPVDVDPQLFTKSVLH